ncbi:hypothetical protein NQZ68_031363 [Dissostichus eleginoides]|nr:hypothetical protein NQZ68_031363 [Dissostichus eleginoides]
MPGTCGSLRRCSAAREPVHRLVNLSPAGPGRSPVTALGLLAVLLSVLSGGADGQPCPAQCSCTGTTVDCHGQGLRSVPRNIPRNTERL